MYWEFQLHCEAGQAKKPSLQRFYVVRVAYLSSIFILGNYELFHDYGEDSDADHHAKYSDQFFKVTYGVQITVSYGGKHCNCVVTANNEPICYIVRFKFENFKPSLTIFFLITAY